MSGSSIRFSYLFQFVVKSVFVYCNGDFFFVGCCVVIYEKKVFSFDVFLKEVIGGVQVFFGVVRNIYMLWIGYCIWKLDQIQSGGNYVVGGQEVFKKFNYLDIGEIKKRLMEVVNIEVKLVIYSRINVLVCFRKLFQEFCIIFLIVNGDFINLVFCFFIFRKVLNQWDYVL